MKPKHQLASLNILLAEDDADDRAFFEKALRAIPIGTHLMTVHDGEGLMNYLSKNIEHLPDVLFLDLSMPRKTGFEALSEIKGSEKLKGLPVVVFTIAFPHDVDFEMNIKNMLSALGSSGFISKTSDLPKLRDAIQSELIKVLENKSPHDGSITRHVA